MPAHSVNSASRRCAGAARIAAILEAAGVRNQDIHVETKKFVSQLINSIADLPEGPQRLDEIGVEADGGVGVMPPAGVKAALPA